MTIGFSAHILATAMASHCLPVENGGATPSSDGIVAEKLKSGLNSRLVGLMDNGVVFGAEVVCQDDDVLIVIFHESASFTSAVTGAPNSVLDGRFAGLVKKGFNVVVEKGGKLIAKGVLEAKYGTHSNASLVVKKLMDIYRVSKMAAK